MRVALTSWALAALLPPGAWALCLGAHGHVALEPAATSCQNEAAAAPGDASCAATSCESCVDVPLLRGVALRTILPRVDAPLASLPARVAADPGVVAPPLSPVLADPGAAPASSHRAIILRC